MLSITDDSGTLITQQRYLPFGGMRQLANYQTSGLTDYTYTGQRTLDPGMGGLMDYKARFYSPALGSFIQPDTLIPNPANPQVFNRFSYVANRPVNFNDPSGHEPGSYCDRGYCDSNRNIIMAGDPEDVFFDLDNEVVAGVCGSDTINGITAPGPNCIDKTDPNNPIIHLEDLDSNAPPGFSVFPVLFPGGNPPKPEQVKLIAALSPDALICYSAGVDSCLIYMTTEANSVNKMVLIGGAYYAQYTSDPASIISMDSGPQPFKDGFTGVIKDLAEKGVHILIINDNNIAGDPNIPTGGNIQHVLVPENHLDVDNPASSIWVPVWSWMNDPTYQYHSP